MKQQTLDTRNAFRRGWTGTTLLLSAMVLMPQHGPAQECDRSPILVRNASLWSPSEPARYRDVLFVDDRVASIAPRGSTKPTAAMRVIDGKGHTLLPGLIDLHLHLGVPGGLPDAASASPSRHWQITGRQLLRSGVTSGRTHMTTFAAATLLGKDTADPCSALPRLHFSGPEIGGGSALTNTPNFVGVSSPDDAAAKVRRAAEAGFEWVSLYDAGKFLPGELHAITATARQAGIRLMGPIGSADEMAAVLHAGVDTIDDIDTTSATGYPRGLLQTLKSGLAGATLVPTVGYAYRLHAFDQNPHLLDAQANYEFLTPTERDFVASAAKEALTKDTYVVNGRRVYATLRTKFRQLLASGMPVATGTDVGSAAHFQAGGIWWELEAWRAFGARPRDALTAATATGARVLHDDRAGSLERGAHADFVLYAGDVEHGAFELARVRAVARGGVLFVRDGAWVGPQRPAD
jgi:imidazolonepropionase-like amidohydrolase